MALGGFFACVRRNDGSNLKCFGLNNEGQLGLGDTTGPNVAIGDEPSEIGANLPTVALPPGTVVRDFVGTPMHACALSR